MSDNIDWSKAPEGTTHALRLDENETLWWRKQAGAWYLHDPIRADMIWKAEIPTAATIARMALRPTSQPDWSKAPEGATHYNADCVYPWLCATPAAYFIDGRGWMDYAEPAHAKRAFDGAVPRPKLPDAAIVFDQKDPDAVATVDFAQAMVRRLGERRAAGKSGWDDPEQCPPQRLAEGLVRSLRAGNLVDVGNYAMMLWKRGQTDCFAPQVAADLLRDAFLKLNGVALSHPARHFPSAPEEKDNLEMGIELPSGSTRVEWDGTGLPPVGTLVGVHYSDQAPYEAMVVAEHLGEVVLWIGNGARTNYWRCDPAWLRPILTPEQRAAKERDEAVAAMLADADVDPFESAREESMAQALYAAGWRKTEGE